MSKLRAPLMTLLLGASCVLAQAAPPEKTPPDNPAKTNLVTDVTVRAKEEFEISPDGDVSTASNDVVGTSSNAVLTAEPAAPNRGPREIYPVRSLRRPRGRPRR